MKFSLSFLLVVLTGALTVSADTDFDPVQLLPPFDPIVEPEIAGPAEAGKWVEDDEIVLGNAMGSGDR